VAGIGLSLIPVIVTLIVADGMIRGITDRFIELGTGHIQVWPYREAAGEDGSAAALDAEDADILSLIRETQGVRGVWRQRESLGIIAGSTGKTGISIRAIETSYWQDEGSRRYFSAVAGEALITADNEALIGGELAALTGAEVGKTIRVVTLRQASGGRTVPRTTIFTVKGIISSGYHELDAMWCIISYEAGKKILSSQPSGDPFVVKINNAYKDAAQVAALLNWRLPGDFWAYQWKDLLRSQYSSYESTRQLLLFIMLLIVLVAAVNVSSATSMLVIERQRDIAVLKAFGVSPRMISGIFLWGSFLTGLCGSIIGIGAGLIIGRFINQIMRGIEAVLNFFTAFTSGWTIHLLDPSYYLQSIPIIIDWKTVILIGAFTVLCSCVSGSFPARKAGRAKPTELLRKQ
jgi:lipoprotein-releasing system permease protein